MCGILGCISKTNLISEAAINASIKSMHHRGPDSNNYWISQSHEVALGHSRLSVVGVDNGEQPLFSSHMNIVCVVNGEFYDYKVIRKKLMRIGYDFHTDTDSEILIYLYLEYGDGCLDFLNGEFSFLLWDNNEKLLFGARDRFGTKPLFYYYQNGTFYAASTIKALLELGVKSELNHDAFLDFSFGIPNSKISMFKNILMISPGQYFTLKDDVFKQKYYWKFLPKETLSISAADATNHLLHLLKQSVTRRLEADIPIGCYLSGGVDSSSILALASKINPNIKAFTIGFKDPTFDESEHAKLIAKHLNIDISILDISQNDLANSYAEAIYHRESLVYQSSGVGKFLLSKFVNKQGYKSVITGEGADELLLGYPSHKEDYISNYLSSDIQSRLLEKLLKDNYLSNTAYVSGKNYANFSDIEKMLGFTPSFLKLSYDIADINKSIFTNDLLNLSQSLSPFTKFSNLIGESPITNLGAVEKSQYLWSKTYFPELILSYLGDRMEMAHSVEGRLPFLDNDLVDFINKLPTSLKINRELTDKFILRESMKNHLPNSIRMRNKHIYASPPIGSNIDKNPMTALMETVFNTTEFKNLGIYNQNKTLALLYKLPKLNRRSRMVSEFCLHTALSTYYLHQLFF